MVPSLSVINSTIVRIFCNLFISGVTLTLWANPLNPELCPVTALLVWLLITGLYIIFYIYPYWRKSGTRVPLTVMQCN